MVLLFGENYHLGKNTRLDSFPSPNQYKLHLLDNQCRLYELMTLRSIFQLGNRFLGRLLQDSIFHPLGMTGDSHRYYQYQVDKNILLHIYDLQYFLWRLTWYNRILRGIQSTLSSLVDQLRHRKSLTRRLFFVRLDNNSRVGRFDQELHLTDPY